MHDALGYARVELDVDDIATPAPIRSRVPTEDLTMHVYTLGKWHRRTPDLSHTACGKAIDGQRCPVRREELIGDLCAGTKDELGCFTAFELHQAATNNAKDNEP